MTPNSPPAPREGAPAGYRRGLFDSAHFEHVATGAESFLAGASQDDSGDFRVLGGAKDGVAELVAQRGTKGVVALGTVERQANDRAPAFFDDE